MHHHAEAVAHQQEIHIFVGNGGGVRVIGGKRHNRLATFAVCNVGSGFAFGECVLGHGASDSPFDPSPASGPYV